MNWLIKTKYQESYRAYIVFDKPDKESALEEFKTKMPHAANREEIMIVSKIENSVMVVL